VARDRSAHRTCIQPASSLPVAEIARRLLWAVRMLASDLTVVGMDLVDVIPTAIRVS
jgi:hypothetical protein